MHLNFLHTTQLLFKAYDEVRKNIQNNYQLMGVEVDVLLFLANNPKHTKAQDIVEVRKMTKSHASKAITQLVNKGLLEKSVNPDNKKEFHLKLTPQTIPIINYGQNQQKLFFERLFEGFSKQQLDDFFNSLKVIEHNLIKEAKND